VVNNAKIEHGIHSGVNIGEILGVAHEKEKTISCPLRPSSQGQPNHHRVNVQSIKPGWLKGVQNNSGTSTMATANFQTSSPRLKITQSFKEASFPLLD
jgi:hypothetical protein